MRKVRSIATVTALGAQAAACSIVLGLEHGHPPAVSSEDAGDAGGSVDALDVDAEPLPFCARAAATFCDSFDGPGLAVGWSDPLLYNASAPTIDRIDAVSPPGSLLFDFTPAAEGDRRVSSLFWPIPNPQQLTRVEYSFAVKPEVPIHTVLSILQIADEENDQRQLALWIVDSLLLTLVEQQIANDTATITNVGVLEAANWNSISLRYDATPNAEAVRVLLNGVAAVDHPLTVAAGPVGSTPKVLVGLHTAAVNEFGRIRYDDFSVKVE